MSQNPTVVLDSGVQGWTDAQVNNFPSPWVSEAALQSGGIVNGFLAGNAKNLEQINLDLIFGWLACRLQTAEDDQLDLISQDYFGSQFPRLQNETDDAYRARLQANLLAPKVTKEAIYNFIQLNLNTTPRMLSPWDARDTGAYGYSGYNADSVSRPSRYGGNIKRFSSAIELQPPATTLPCAIYGYGAGAAYGGFTGVYYHQNNGAQYTENQILSFLRDIVAFGFDIGIKFPPSVKKTTNVGGLYPVNANQNNFSLGIKSITGLYAVFASIDTALNVWTTGQSSNSFSLSSAAPTPATTKINYLAASITIPGVNVFYISPGATNLPVTVNSNSVIVACPSWNTNVWWDGTNLNFSVPPSSNSMLSYLIYPLGVNSGNIPLNLSAGLTSYALFLNNAGTVPIVTPNWDTSVGVQVLPNNIVQLNFSTPIPANGAISFVSYPVTGS